MHEAAALTNLQSLELTWNGNGRLGLDVYVPLTALKKLTRLQCWQMNSLTILVSRHAAGM